MIEEYELNFEQALQYFDQDDEHLEFLRNLSEWERDGYRLVVSLDTRKHQAFWREGNFWKETNNLPQFGNGIDNTISVEDDYEGVVEKLRDMRLLKGGE